jgi:hypothetical protein
MNFFWRIRYSLEERRSRYAARMNYLREAACALCLAALRLVTR